MTGKFGAGTFYENLLHKHKGPHNYIPSFPITVKLQISYMSRHLIVTYDLKDLVMSAPPEATCSYIG